MLRYITRRLLWAVALLFIVTAAVFVIFNVLPSADPAQLRAGRGASVEQVENVRKSLGLDDPMHERFARYVEGVVTEFDLGTSYFQNNEPVRDIIFDRLPATILLVAGAVVLWIAMAIPVGVISAIRRRSALDRSAMIITLTLISAPVFWLGLVALYLFADDIGLIQILPGQGAYNDASSLGGRLAALILPWIVLAGATAAIYARYVRSEMIEVMGQDYIRTARAKGLRERDVVMRHGLRSALTPVVTLLGIDIGVLLAGNAILTETVFNIPGIGGELAQAIGQSDYELIQGIVLFGAFFIVICSLIVDIVYAWLDPRVRYS